MLLDRRYQPDVVSGTQDLECSLSGRLLKVHYKNGHYLRIEFTLVEGAYDFAERYPKVANIPPGGLRNGLECRYVLEKLGGL